jgi:hypothetical protein
MSRRIEHVRRDGYYGYIIEEEPLSSPNKIPWCHGLLCFPVIRCESSACRKLRAVMFGRGVRCSICNEDVVNPKNEPMRDTVMYLNKLHQAEVTYRTYGKWLCSDFKCHFIQERSQIVAINKFASTCFPSKRLQQENSNEEKQLQMLEFFFYLSNKLHGSAPKEVLSLDM